MNLKPQINLPAASPFHSLSSHPKINISNLTLSLYLNKVKSSQKNESEIPESKSMSMPISFNGS